MAAKGPATRPAARVRQKSRSQRSGSGTRYADLENALFVCKDTSYGWQTQ